MKKNRRQGCCAALSGGLRFLRHWWLGLNMLALATVAVAQPALEPAAPARPSSQPTVLNPAKVWVAKNGESWQALRPDQKAALQPLAAKWDSLKKNQQRKWLVIAENYAKLSPAEQEKLHNRMTEWASLNQRQRAEARLNFAKSNRLTPDQKKQTWQAYQALSPEEKKSLTSAAPKKIYIAPATKPKAQAKLAHRATPASQPAPQPAFEPSAQAQGQPTPKINPRTLLVSQSR